MATVRIQYEYDVYKEHMNDDGYVTSASKVTTIWLPLGEGQTFEDRARIAREHGGTLLCPTTRSRIGATVTDPRAATR